MNEHIPGTLIGKNVVRDYNQRCFVVHGTHNVTLADNVAFNNFWNCYMFEDGVEEGNTFARNLGAMTKKMPKDKLLTDDDTDDDPATFWITNPTNDM